MFTHKRALSLLLKLCIATSFTSLVMAINPTSEMPIEIESDKASLDDEKGISNYSGNVIVTQGLSRLEADSVTVNTVNRKVVSITATGQPAHFIQQESAGAPPTHGYGNTIIYLASDAILKLKHGASLVQQGNSFSGELIEYDMLRKAIKAKGDEITGSRVKIQYFPHVSNKQSVEPTPDNAVEPQKAPTGIPSDTNTLPVSPPNQTQELQ